MDLFVWASQDLCTKCVIILTSQLLLLRGSCDDSLSLDFSFSFYRVHSCDMDGFTQSNLVPAEHLEMNRPCILEMLCLNSSPLAQFILV